MRFTPLTRSAQHTDRADQRRGMGTAVANLGVRPFDMTGRPTREIIAAAGGTLDDMTLERRISRSTGGPLASGPGGS